ncbi:MAG: iron ABC transporter substrate-binding protein [Intrasporangiaceae bacterium]|nr:iron ABC transporter substrate-binding protein [Intrasporangiaceae bacterium]
MHLRPRIIAVPALAALALAGCGSGETSDSGTTAPSTDPGTASEAAGEQTVTIYSGRNENLVGPIIEKVQEATGATVEVRYGDSAELAAQLLEEGDRTQADLFFSQDAGALGALAKEGRLAELDDSITGVVLDGYSDTEGHWVATSARARVIAYNPEIAPEVEQMTSIDDILDPTYKGQVGIAPTNASFQSFVTALRVAKGEDGAREWLSQLKANEPKIYEKNGGILDAVDSGEVGLGLINHYYWYEKADEVGLDNLTAKIHFLGTDDPGALINVAGVGILEGSEEADAAAEVIEYFLSEEGQQYFTDETSEYPVVDGITLKEGLTPLADLRGSTIDLNQLDSLGETLALLDEVGLT